MTVYYYSIDIFKSFFLGISSWPASILQQNFKTFCVILLSENQFLPSSPVHKITEKFMQTVFCISKQLCLEVVKQNFKPHTNGELQQLLW